MNPISNWDDIDTSFVDTPLIADGYICKILDAQIVTSKKNFEMLKLDLDISEGDFKNYFTSKFQQRKKFNANSKFPCSFYVLTDNLQRFKKFISDVEKSNPNFNFKKCNFDEKALINKFVGFVFREEEFDFNSKRGFNVKPYFSTSTDNIRNKKFRVPPIKFLSDDMTEQNNNSVDLPF